MGQPERGIGAKRCGIKKGISNAKLNLTCCALPTFRLIILNPILPVLYCPLSLSLSSLLTSPSLPKPFYSGFIRGPGDPNLITAVFGEISPRFYISSSWPSELVHPNDLLCLNKKKIYI